MRIGRGRGTEVRRHRDAPRSVADPQAREQRDQEGDDRHGEDRRKARTGDGQADERQSGESDRDRRILYLHVIGVRSRADVDAFRYEVLRWERRIVRAVGTPEQYAALRADEKRGGAR